MMLPGKREPGMHAYEHGRLDLPFVGHCTFAKRPA
jgi:hypothetical protein